MSSPIPINASGVSTAFAYQTQTVQGSGVSPTIGASPGFINPPIIFEPPPALAGNAINVEIVATGSVNWGGCQVYVSLDNTTYGLLGTIFSGQVQGQLTSDFPIGPDPDTAQTLAVDVTMSQGTINPAAQIYADDFVSLAIVGRELIGYTAATLTSDFNYSLGTYIRRGVYGTTIADHPSGTQFGLITATTFRQTFPFNLLGQTVYFKFPSFNTMGLQTQALADCPAYSYVLAGSGLSPNPWYQSWSVGGRFTDFVIDPYDGNYEIFDVQMPIQTTFGVNLAGSPAPGCEIAPAVTATLTLQKISGGTATTIGTVVFAGGGTAGTYNVPTSQVFNVGDRMRLYAPASVDTTISGAYGTIVGSQPV